MTLCSTSFASVSVWWRVQWMNFWCAAVSVTSLWNRDSSQSSGFISGYMCTLHCTIKMFLFIKSFINLIIIYYWEYVSHNTSFCLYLRSNLWRIYLFQYIFSLMAHKNKFFVYFHTETESSACDKLRYVRNICTFIQLYSKSPTMQDLFYTCFFKSSAVFSMHFPTVFPEKGMCFTLSPYCFPCIMSAIFTTEGRTSGPIVCLLVFHCYVRSLRKGFWTFIMNFEEYWIENSMSWNIWKNCRVLSSCSVCFDF